jgi:hypothetical protein
VDITKLYEIPCKATWNSLAQGYLEFGFAVTFEKKIVRIKPSEYSLPTEAFITKFVPRVVATFISVEENTMKAAFGSFLQTGVASFPQAGKSSGYCITDDANMVGSLKIEPLYGTVGPTLMLNNCETEFFDDLDISADKLLMLPLRFQALNDGEIGAADWSFTVGGDGSVESTTRQKSYELIRNYIRDNYTMNCHIVAAPPEEFFPGIPMPAVFIVERSSDSIFQDKRILRTTINLNIYNWSASDPFGIDTTTRLNNLLTSLTKDFSSIKKNIPGFSINGRVKSSTPAVKRIGNEIQKAILSLELFVNEV